MIKRGFTAILLLALLGTFAPEEISAADATAPAARRNVLLICVDDLKPALGAYGDEHAISPNLDKLAARGMLFENAYCNQAVCAPSRNALLTGIRPTTSGIYDLGTNFRRVHPDAITLPQYFKEHGYRTEGLGKIFHVGHGNHEDPRSWSVPHLPGKVVAYAERPGRALTREEALFANVPWDEAQKLERGAPFEAEDVPDEAYPDGQMAAEAINRLRQAAAQPEQPFFMALGFVKPHLPFCAPKKYWDLYNPEEFDLAPFQERPEDAPRYAPQYGIELSQYAGVPRWPIPPDLQRKLIHGYYAALSYADAQIGKVLNELQQLGLAENTVVLLWGDHGYHLGDHGMWCKHTNYEQAARIPLLVAGPGVKSGARTEALAETVDIYPTLCQLAGLPVPEPPQGLDGASLAPVLKNPSLAGKKSILHAYPRSPQGRGQLIGRALRTERYRLVEWKKPGADPASADLELYDYQEDPFETQNLASEKPEVVQTLRKLLATYPEAKPQHR